MYVALLPALPPQSRLLLAIGEPIFIILFFLCRRWRTKRNAFHQFIKGQHQKNKKYLWLNVKYELGARISHPLRASKCRPATVFGMLASSRVTTKKWHHETPISSREALAHIIIDDGSLQLATQLNSLAYAVHARWRSRIHITADAFALLNTYYWPSYALIVS